MESNNHPVVPTSTDLLDMIYFEILNNIDFYRHSLIADDDFIEQLEDYIISKKYTSDIVDLIVVAACNVLNIKINIYILRNNHYELNRLMVINPAKKSVAGINLLRSGEHFNSISFRGTKFRNKLLY